jgi:WD40 repeat protein
VNTLYVKGNFLYSGGFDAIAKKWNTTSGLSISDYIGHDDAIFSLQIYGDYLLSGSMDMTIKLWDLETTQNTFTIGGTALFYESLISSGAMGCSFACIR